ncbi:endonuclease/exonuclease/phosphatase family protein [Noviherbaspirillum pedocola]|uniref:Endonuclease/exonuclease/phosphatase family protein n=1 Tax=Noviherbaspirillum pedocola TaxID=2801341 RepID=A0A934SQ49_9BURK|nr:endonuclease/exonuclease/phosphatase family protein [Noviherbaspirillum pedocola]MBK4733414.1 endonuclease/exonuclease/phosphatase family protein [Noviherbaspirillum pedocola]
MQQEIRFATFNVCNLALPGVRYYDGIEPYTDEEYDLRIAWLAQQLDRLDADVIGLQEVFSAAALRDTLAKTRHYRDAWHVCEDARQPDGKPAPGVALISRLRIDDAEYHRLLPGENEFLLPQRNEPVAGFTRPVLRARLMLTPTRALHLFVLHLKSQRPDYIDDSGGATADAVALAMLRSLMRRGIDAWGVRRLIAETLAREAAPVMVMGDFNDSADAVTTRIAMAGAADSGEAWLRHCSRLVGRRDPLRDTGYTHIHAGRHDSIDHVLVSQEFDPAAENAIAEAIEVGYLNDHLSVPTPGASDHGAVLVRVRLKADAADPGA